MMYKITLCTLLALATVVSSNPLPTNIPNQPESATVVDVASSSYSSLIVFNPAASPPTTSDSFLTPSGVTVPEAATLSLQGNLPSTSASPLGASPSATGVRVVGSGSSAMESGTADSDASGAGDKENSAKVMTVGWMGLVGVVFAAVLGSGLV